ncbi:exportin [Anaeramoeba flamelloides]|uniref:Exportin n=1 Tax=Anaeramoeba flamelloides TaxID=1746091 RepID=A0AAV7ZVA2_9EUKA|nr:exportin [Anaeramoeba flamelloides]
MDIFENFDTISYDFYMSTDQERRNEIDEALRQSATDVGNLGSLHQILVGSTSIYSLMLSLTLLKEMLTNHWESLTKKGQDEFYDFLLDYIVKNGQKLPKTVLKECFSIYSRILKMSWFNNQKTNENLLNEFKPLFFLPLSNGKSVSEMNQEELAQLTVGLQLLIGLSEEFNYIIKEREVLLKHRKIVTSFRDHALLSFMYFVLKLLEFFLPSTTTTTTITTNSNTDNKIRLDNELLSKNFTTTPIELPKEEASLELLFETCLRLFYAILSFDFSGFGRVNVIGGTDTSRLSFSTTWRKRIKIHDILNLTFSLFFGCSTCEERVIARLEVLMKCLELLSSIRGVTYENEEDKISFLGNVLYGASIIAENNLHLLSENVLHEYCRLSYKVIVNHRFQTLISTTYLDRWITSIHQLSITCLENITNLHSNYYLLGIWVRIVQEIGPSKLHPINQDQNNNNNNNDLNNSYKKITEMIGDIVQDFIFQKLSYWGNIGNEIDFQQIYDLESEFMLEINNFKVLGRIDYQKTFLQLIEFFEKVSKDIQENGLKENYFLQLCVLIVFSGSLISQTITKPMQFSLHSLSRGAIYLNFTESQSYFNFFLPKTHQLYNNNNLLISGINNDNDDDNNNNNNITNDNDKNDNNNDDDDNQKNYYFDAELTLRIIRLIQWLENLENKFDLNSSLKFLELSFIYFFEQFNLIYVSEQSEKILAFFNNFPEIVPNVESKYEQMILFIYLKIKNNLKKYYSDEHIITRTLQLFDKFVDQYKAGQTLINFEEIDQLLKNHNTENFQFLEIFLSRSRIRVMYYKTIGKLLFLENKEMPFIRKFNNFINIFDDSFSQLNQYFDNLKQQWQNGQYDLDESMCITALSLLKDLRGTIIKCNHDWKFVVFFDWFYPSKIETLNNFFKFFKKIPKISNNLLKFWNEFASLTITKDSNRQNSSKKSSFFHSSSPDGIIIFKLICNAIQIFAQEFSNDFNDLPDEYSTKFKSLSICQSTISNLVQNSFVDLGVFEAFNDDCLQKTVHLIFELSESVDLQYIPINPKFNYSYYRLLETFSREYLEVIINRPEEKFYYLINIIINGLLLEKRKITEKCCVFVESLLSFYYSYYQNELLRNLKKKKLAQILHVRLQQNDQNLMKIIKIFINSLIYQPNMNVWGISKPLLPLILIYTDIFHQIKENIISSLEENKQKIILKLFDSIFIDIKDNLEPENYSTFGQNLNRFRYKMRDNGYLF